jgi:hypothetical protein
VTLDLATTLGKRVDRDLTARVESAVREQSTGQVGQVTLTLEAASLDEATRLLPLGAMVVLQGRRYQVGRRERRVLPDGKVVGSYRCRSLLAKTLRSEYVTRASSKVSAAQWVAAVVRRAGGKSIVQPSAVRETITQRGGSERTSSLKAIEGLAGSLQWSWSESDGQVIFASGYAILTGAVTVPVYKVNLATMGEFAPWDSDDASEATGGATLLLPAGHAADPLHAINLTGAGTVDSGRWVIESTAENLLTEDGVTVNLTRPRRPIARHKDTKKGTATA